MQQEKLIWTENTLPKSHSKYTDLMDPVEIEKVRLFHQSFPEYTQTPLIPLKSLASQWGIKGLFIKDESYRFGLNAFKVLGGSYAMANYIAKSTGRNISSLNYSSLISPDVQKELGQVVFFTATDGNHGRGVAWSANRLGQKSVVLMPKGSSLTRLEAIRRENADVTIENANYDECVRKAYQLSLQTPGGVIVQDTAWDGYEEIPSWIMQGYGTMALEAAEQLKLSGEKAPTHIFLQAGVGSFAGAMEGFFAAMFPHNPISFILCEANQADCLYQSAYRGNGDICSVQGDMPTIMAGLACGEPNTISWEILRNHTNCFVSAPDYTAAVGMRILGAPLRGDTRVISGESGALPLGTLSSIITDPSYKDLREQLNINCNSVVLCFSTEGDTDPQQYRRIVWDGAYPYPMD